MVDVPDELAGWVLNSILRDLAGRVRRDGGTVSPDAQRLLYRLHEADQRRSTTGIGSHPTERPTVGAAVTVTEAAQQMECRPEWVRHLCRTGRLDARRSGGVWLIDPDSLTTYRRPQGAAHSGHAA